MPYGFTGFSSSNPNLNINTPEEERKRKEKERLKKEALSKQKSTNDFVSSQKPVIPQPQKISTKTPSFNLDFSSYKKPVTQLSNIDFSKGQQNQPFGPGQTIDSSMGTPPVAYQKPVIVAKPVYVSTTLQKILDNYKPKPKLGGSRQMLSNLSKGLGITKTSGAQLNVGIKQPTGPQNFFSDEKEAYNAMITDGIDDKKARDTIEYRRKTMLGNIKLDEAQALLNMQKDGLNTETAVNVIKEYRKQQDEKFAKENPIANIGRGLFNVPVGAVALGTEQVGNIADFVTGGKAGFGEDVAKIKAQNQYLEDSTGANIGRYTLGIGEMLAGGPTKLAPTIYGRMGQGAVVGAYQGATMPVLEKGSDATMSDIGTSTVQGGVMGAAAVPVFEKVLAPVVGGVLNKTMKYGKAGYKGGFSGMGKSVGEDIVGLGKSVGNYTSKVAPGLQLKGLLNPQKLEYVSNTLIKDGQKSPADVGKWMLDRNIKGSKEEIIQQLEERAKQSMTAVDDTLKVIDDTVGEGFINKEANIGAGKIADDFEGSLSPELQAKAKRMRELANKEKLTLIEQQEIKRALDERYSIYKLSTEVRENKIAQDLDFLRKGIRKSIEDTAEKYGAGNIRMLNNETAVSKALSKGIQKKSNAETIREIISPFSGQIIGGAIGGTAGGPFKGDDYVSKTGNIIFGALVGKGLNSTYLKSNIASMLNKLSKQEIGALERYYQSGGKENVKFMSDYFNKVKGRLALPEAGKSSFVEPTKKPIITPYGDIGKAPKQPGTSNPLFSKDNKNVTNNNYDNDISPANGGVLALPSEGQSTYKKPAIITPQTKEAGIILDSKKGLENTKFGNNKTVSGMSQDYNLAKQLIKDSDNIGDLQDLKANIKTLNHPRGNELLKTIDDKIAGINEINIPIKEIESLKAEYGDDLVNAFKKLYKQEVNLKTTKGADNYSKIEFTKQKGTQDFYNLAKTHIENSSDPFRSVQELYDSMKSKVSESFVKAPVIKAPEKYTAKQTKEAGIILDSKKGLENTKFGNNKVVSKDNDIKKFIDDKIMEYNKKGYSPASIKDNIGGDIYDKFGFNNDSYRKYTSNKTKEIYNESIKPIVKNEITSQYEVMTPYLNKKLLKDKTAPKPTSNIDKINPKTGEGFDKNGKSLGIVDKKKDNPQGFINPTKIFEDFYKAGKYITNPAHIKELATNIVNGMKVGAKYSKQAINDVIEHIKTYGVKAKEMLYEVVERINSYGRDIKKTK